MHGARFRKTRVVLAGAALFACAPRQAEAPDADVSLKCADRGPPVPHRGAIAPARGDADVLVTDRTVIYRDDKGSLVARTLADGATVGTSPATGRLVLGDERGVVLWEEAAGARRLAQIRWADGRVRRSDPLPLPPWAVTSSGGDAADSVAAAFDGEDVVVAWTAQTFYRGGTPPPPEVREAAHHEDCGSLRIDARGRVLQGGKIAVENVPVPRSPIPARSYLQQLYAGAGLYWTNDIHPVTGIARHAIVEPSGASTEVQLPALPPETRADVNVWATADRVVVLRVMRRRESYEHARSLIVLDRKTGAQVWVGAMASVHESPPIP